MSGGHYDYKFSNVDDLARDIESQNNPRRVAFKKLLVLVAKACHDIEWVDSADYSPRDENESIDKVLNFCKMDNDKILKSVMFDELMEKYNQLKENL